MAENMNGSRTKADLIVEKLDRFDGRVASVEKDVNAFAAAVEESKSLAEAAAKANAEEQERIKTEIKYVSAQLESVCISLNSTLTKITEELAELKRKQQPDLDELASLVASKIVIPEVGRSAQQQELDYDALGYAVAKSIYVPQAVAEEIDYDDLATKIADKLPAPEYVVPAAEPACAEVDYDLIAARVAAAVDTTPVSPEYIAARVAEQIVVPAAEQIDYETLAEKISERIVLPEAESVVCAEEQVAPVCEEVVPVVAEEAHTVVDVDSDAIAEEVVQRLTAAIAESLNPDEIADCVAKRVGSVSPEEFEITVDDDGCDSLAKSVEEKLDYEELAAKISEKLAPVFMGMGVAGDIDPDELATAISDKLTVNAAVNEDALAEKAAAILSNYMPEVDSADIADKVIAGVIPAIPSAAAIDTDAIVDDISAKIVENQADSDFDIVIDEEGVAAIAENISEGMKDELDRINAEQYEKVEGELLSVKEEVGVVKEEVSRIGEESRQSLQEEISAVKEEYSARFDKVDEDIEEIKKMLLAGAVVAVAANANETAVAQAEGVVEEELVTVSDVVGEEPAEEVVEEQDEVIEEIVSDLSETPADGEILPDGMDEEEGGVDFANMMKYNRSFIARIIQGTDEQKNYYGQVKTALLSYKKVNSNVAWGAERFNKGRETIARFKIRGKTLCLYLALDPKEFEYSVYHQADISDNKSMHGTPMMVKIKSPRGVKKAIRLIDAMLEKRDGVKRTVAERDYAAMYPYETIEELIEDGLVKDVSKK